MRSRRSSSAGRGASSKTVSKNFNLRKKPQRERAPCAEGDENDREEEHQWEACIKSEAVWWSPAAFEQFRGKGASKKLRSTIVYSNYPLQHWIDCGDLAPSPVKKRQSAASERPYSNKGLTKASGEDSHQTKEAEPVKQDGGRTNGILKGVKSVTSKKKPTLILHKLKGDFCSVLNSATLLPKDGPVPLEEPMETSEGDRAGSEENQEPTLEQDRTSSNEEEEGATGSPPGAAGDAPEPPEQTENDIIQMDESNGAQKEEMTEEQMPTENEETVEPQGATSGNDVLEDDAPSAATESKAESSPPEQKDEDPVCHDEEPEEKVEDGLKADETKEPQENSLPCDNGKNKNEEAMLFDDIPSATSPDVPDSEIPNGREDICVSLPSEMAIQDVVPAATTQESTEETESDEAEKDANVQNLKQESLIKRPTEGDGPCAPTNYEATTARTLLCLDNMDLEQLKKEKLKMQIKVLLLQEEYHALQIKKLNQ